MSDPTAIPSLQFYQISDTPRLPDTGANAVHFWASTNNQKFLEESGVDSLLVTDWFGNYPLHYAAACSSYTCAEHILKHHPKNHFFNKDRLTPAHIAAQKGDVRMLQIFQKAEFLMTDVTDLNWTILHFAVIYGHLEAVKYILDNCDNSMLYVLTDGVDPLFNSCKKKDLQFYSVLDLARIMKNEEMTNLLLKYHALPSLHSSVLSRNYRAFSYFLFSPHSAYKNKINDAAQYRKCTALHLAAAYDYYEMCHSLLMSGASTELVDVDGYSALDVALIHDATNSAQIILPRCSPTIVSAAYCIALDLKNTWIFKTPVNFKYDYIDPSTRDSLLIRFIKRLTPETYTEGTSLAAKAILANSPRQNILSTFDAYGATAFHYAASSEIPDFYTNLLSMIKEESPLDMYGETTLAYCVRSANKKTLPLINRKFTESADKFNMTPALYNLITELCTENGGLISMETLSHGYRIKVEELYQEINKPRSDAKRTIFNYKTHKKKTVDCPLIEIYSKPLRDIFDNDCKRMTQFFDKHGKLSKCSFIYAAILFTKAYSTDYFKILLECVRRQNFQFDLINLKDEDGRSPLMFAAMLRRSGHISELLNYGADIKCLDNERNTIWHYVDTERVFRAIIESRLGENQVSITTEDVNIKGENPVHIACKNGNIAVLRCFARIISDNQLLQMPDNEGRTPLDNSLSSNSNSCIEFLHSKGVENRLIMAIQNGDSFENIEDLINHGYPVNSSDRLKNTPLHAAVKTKNGSLVSYLITKGADVNAMNANMKTPLHLAAEIGCLEIIKILLRNKIDVTALPLENQPFIFASEHQSIKTFLFNYWKRQFLGHKFIEDFIFKCKDTLMALAMSSLVITDKVNPELDKSFRETLDKMSFVLKKLLAMRPRNPKPFSFMFSLHQLLLILTTIDLSHYQQLIKKDIARENYAADPTKSLIRIFLYLYPLRWMNYASEFLDKLQFHLLPGIDNIEIVRNNIFSSINTQTAENNKIFDQVNQKIAEHLELSKIRLPQKVYLKQAGQENPAVIIATTVKVDEVSCDPTCIFYPQFSMYLKVFYGDSFTLPRCIPFHNGHTIKVILFSNNTIAFVSTKDSNVYLVLPIELILIKTLKKSPKDEDIHIVTPIGSFNMVQIANPQASAQSSFVYSILTDSLFFAQETCVQYNDGESLMAGTNNESKTFMCLVIYQLVGKKTIDLRMIILKADASNQCYDLVQNHISNSIPSKLVFLRVIPFLADTTVNAIVFV